MEIASIYGMVLTIVLVGILLGVGIIVLDNFAASAGVTSAASTALNGTRDAIDDWVTWLPIIVLVAAASVILTLVIRSFQG